MSLVALMLAKICMALAMVELLLRGFGLHRFPLFRRDGRAVYCMGEQQHGLFRHRIVWAYNECGMRTDRPFVATQDAVIVLGDSVVDGGLRLTQSETLARRIEAATSYSVYPLACHGWALRNQIEALAALPGWNDCGALVWVLNPGDLDTIGQGESVYSFPEHRPRLLSLWLLRRYLLRRWGMARRADRRNKPEPAQVLRHRNLKRAKEVLGRFQGTVLIVRFPARDERFVDDSYWRLLSRIHPRAHMLEIARAGDWNRDCYIDGLHPSPQGVELLASQIAAALPKSSNLADESS